MFTYCIFSVAANCLMQESLCEQFEDLLGSAPGMEESDVSLSSGVLTVELPGRGIYVINRQSPNRQIWLSSPESGPARFDHQEGRWIYRRTGESLHELLDREVGEQVAASHLYTGLQCYSLSERILNVLIVGSKMSGCHV